jgi:hypothetical protein
MIDRMLTVDVTKRATLAELKECAWLNKYSSTKIPPTIPRRSPSGEINFPVLEKLALIGFEEEEVIDDIIHSRKTKQSYVLYHLMVDQIEKEKEEEASKRAAVQQMLASNLMKKLRNSNPNLYTIPENEDLAGQQIAPHNPIEDIPTSSTRINRARTWDSLDNVPSTLVPPFTLKTTSSNEKEGTGSNASDTNDSVAQHEKNGFSFKNVIDLFKKKKSVNANNKASIASKASNKFRRSSHDLKELEKMNSQIVVEEGEDTLEMVKGAFSCDTTTTKSLSEIHFEITRVFAKLGISYTLNNHIYTCKTTNPETKMKIKFELQVCKIEKFDHFKGVRFRRTGGDTWSYRDVVQKQILESLKL